MRGNEIMDNHFLYSLGHNISQLSNIVQMEKRRTSQLLTERTQRDTTIQYNTKLTNRKKTKEPKDPTHALIFKPSGATSRISAFLHLTAKNLQQGNL